MFRSRELVVLLWLTASAGCVPRPDPISMAPWIWLSTQKVALRHAVGVGHAPGESVSIRNVGGDSFGKPQIGVEYVEEAGDWLGCELSGDGSTYELRFRPRNPDGGPLAAGTYHAKVEVAAAKAANSPMFIDVTAEVALPQIVARPEALAIAGALGGKAWLPRLRVEEALAGDLPEPAFDLALPAGQTWLQLGTTFQAWSELDGADYWDPDLRLDTASLARGQYQATVTATTAGVGSVDVAVRLTVNDWGEAPADDSPDWGAHCPLPLSLSDGRILCARTPPWIFDPATGLWSELPPCPSALPIRLTTLLPDGNVLFVHQGSACTTLCTDQAAWALLDPGTGVWLWGGVLPGEHGATATALADGRVLLAGHIQGTTGGNPDEYQPSRSSAVLDPASGTIVQTASMAYSHQHAAAVRLADGRVLVAGGVSTEEWQSRAELFDPRAGGGSWTTTGAMSVARADFSLALLPDGRVLAAGGQNGSGVLSSAEVFDPAAGKWTPVGSMSAPRYAHGNLLPLPDGTLLVTGGLGSSFAPIVRSERYDPATRKWSPWADLPGWRYLHRTALVDGSWVLVFGGEAGDAVAGVIRRLAYP